MKIHLIENSIITVGDEDINLGDLSITQGLSYYRTFFIKGNFLTWIPKAQIRTSYADEGGIVETEFLFKENLFDANLNITYLRPYLKHNQTKDLISTVYQNKPQQIPSKDNCFLYNLIIVNPVDSDDVYPVIDTSFVQIKPGVTL
jgi:hypothetical protein